MPISNQMSPPWGLQRIFHFISYKNAAPGGGEAAPPELNPGDTQLRIRFYFPDVNVRATKSRNNEFDYIFDRFLFPDVNVRATESRNYKFDFISFPIGKTKRMQIQTKVSRL
jgi:hypothetical protein